MTLWKIAGFALCAVFVVLMIAALRISSTIIAMRRRVRGGIGSQRHQPSPTLAAPA